MKNMIVVAMLFLTGCSSSRAVVPSETRDVPVPVSADIQSDELAECVFDYRHQFGYSFDSRFVSLHEETVSGHLTEGPVYGQPFLNWSENPSPLHSEIELRLEQNGISLYPTYLSGGSKLGNPYDGNCVDRTIEYTLFNWDDQLEWTSDTLRYTSEDVFVSVGTDVLADVLRVGTVADVLPDPISVPYSEFVDILQEGPVIGSYEVWYYEEARAESAMNLVALSYEAVSYYTSVDENGKILGALTP